VAYTKHQWQDNNVLAPYGPISAARLGEMEQGIYDLQYSPILQPTGTTAVGLTVKGLASQTGDLFLAQDSGGAELFSIDNLGVLQVSKNAGRGITIGGNLDGNDADSNQRIRVALATGMANGVNARTGGVADAITSDNANGAGASYFNPLYLNNTFGTRGSFQGIWNQAVVNEGPSTDQYNEAVLYFGTLTVNRRGGLAEAAELGVTVNAGKVARASVGTFLITENNALADYATYLGAGTRWAETGAIGTWIGSNGTFAAGTGIFLEALNGSAGFDHAIRMKLAGTSQIPLGAKIIGDTAERVAVKLDGLYLGSGTAVDTTFIRASAKVLQTESSLTVTSLSGTAAFRTNQIAGDVVLRNNLLSADANNAFKIWGDGKHEWGPGGATAVDTNLYRSAAARLATDHLFRATTLGLATKVKAGTPADGDWAVAPPDGTIVVDSTANKIWARVGGVWKGVVIA
jgi:hypothetical protein